MPEVKFPNQEHSKADAAARRRALQCLEGIEAACVILRRRLSGIGSAVSVDAEDGRSISQRAGQLTEHLATLATLRDVREWADADAVERASLPLKLPEPSYGQLRDELTERGITGWDLSTSREELIRLLDENDSLKAISRIASPQPPGGPAGLGQPRDGES